MKKMLFVMIVIALAFIGLAYAQEDFTEAKQLIDSGVGCTDLTDGQLEIIGDYYMEQMHPGEAHEIMDEMMGGEGSESLKQIHTNMARRLHCDENIYVGYGVMGYGGMMGGLWGNNVVGPGMMWGYGYGPGWSIINLLSAGVLLGLLILVILGIIKLLQSLLKGR